MIEFLVWGTIIIITTAISSITLVLGIYYMFTKTKREKKEKARIFKLEDQREIT